MLMVLCYVITSCFVFEAFLLFWKPLIGIACGFGGAFLIQGCLFAFRIRS